MQAQRSLLQAQRSLDYNVVMLSLLLSYISVDKTNDPQATLPKSSGTLLLNA